jgi:dTDP-4-dehydrorhamnose 3,5-epimerase-like enzyme
MGHMQAREKGEIFDVAIDIRRDSPISGWWISVVLSAENRRSVCLRAGCLHGFRVMSPEAQVIYKTTDEYASDSSTACGGTIRPSRFPGRLLRLAVGARSSLAAS